MPEEVFICSPFFGRYADQDGISDFRPTHFKGESEEERSKQFVVAIEKLLIKCSRKPPLERAYLPRCNFTTEVGESESNCEALSQILFRSRTFTDGWIVDKTQEAVIMLSADCPIVAIHDTAKNRLAVLHASYKTVVRDQSILMVPFRFHGFSPDHVTVRVSPGIGPCCYGVEHYPVMKDISYVCAVRGPREGQRSVDLQAIIKQQLEKQGVPCERITTDALCTACYEADGKYRYHSHCRDGESAGRNAVIFWLQ